MRAETTIKLFELLDANPSFTEQKDGKQACYSCLACRYGTSRSDKKKSHIKPPPSLLLRGNLYVEAWKPPPSSTIFRVSVAQTRLQNRRGSTALFVHNVRTYTRTPRVRPNKETYHNRQHNTIRTHLSQSPTAFCFLSNFLFLTRLHF